jgi:signal transduction histidine kinase
MRKLKSTTGLVLFSTSLITTAFFVFYFMLITQINEDAARNEVGHRYAYDDVNFLVLLAVAVLLAYVISYIIIDRIYNPFKLMINKVKEIGNMDFGVPLIINSQDDELREYVTAFNEMSRKLSDHIERRKRFISDASHELVTPITVINGHAALLLRKMNDNPELLENGLTVIKTEALRMDALISNLLLLAKSDSGRLDFTYQKSDLTELIKETVNETLLLAPDFNILTEIGNGIYANCDENSIRRVLRAVMSNAVKYSDTEKSIRVECYETHGLVNITVADKGIGIAAEHIPNIFDRFYRVDDSRSKKTGSSGLGLAIAKEIVDAHGGEIRVSSEAGRGTEITITLSV